MKANWHEMAMRAGERRRRGRTWIEAGRFLGGGIGLTFTDRRGGVSPAPYDTLNLAQHTGDTADNVTRNRLELARYLGVAPHRFIFLEQVHGLRVARISAEHCGGEAGAFPAALPASDGALTRETGVVLCVLTADCVPVAIAETCSGAVALLHAGWRGTVGDIVAVAMEMMVADAGVKREKARAVLGPAIAPCCYGVDEGRAGLFVERYGEGSMVVKGDDMKRVDLVRANVLNLMEAGLREENIMVVSGCTCCGHGYFSFRRDEVTGRQGTFLYMREERDHGRRR